MLACFVCPGRSRVAFKILVPVCLRFVESGLFFVAKCAVEKCLQQIAVELERFVETVETTTEVSLFKPGNAEIVIDLSLIFTASERLFEFSDRLVKLPLRQVYLAECVMSFGRWLRSHRFREMQLGQSKIILALIVDAGSARCRKLRVRKCRNAGLDWPLVSVSRLQRSQAFVELRIATPERPK